MNRYGVIATLAVLVFAMSSCSSDNADPISLEEAIAIADSRLRDDGYEIDVASVSSIVGLGLDDSSWNLVTRVDNQEIHVSVDKVTGEVTRVAIRR